MGNTSGVRSDGRLCPLRRAFFISFFYFKNPKKLSGGGASEKKTEKYISMKAINRKKYRTCLYILKILL